MSSRRRGFTLIEAVFSVLIVSVMFVAVIKTVASSRMIQYKTNGYSQGVALAQGLMAEIVPQDYEEPVDTPVFGPESPEVAGSRQDWDDVDDYHGWVSTPPQHRDGTVMTEFPGWTRIVVVNWIDSDAIAKAKVTETDAKRITILVSHNGVTMAQLVAVRTRTFPTAGW